MTKFSAALTYPVVTSQGARRRRRPAAGTRPITREGMYRLISPMLIFLTLMVGLPLVYAFWLSLTAFRFGQEPAFNAGLNYWTMLFDPLFWKGLRITMVLYVMSLALQMVGGLWLGLVLHRLAATNRLIRTVLISPFIIPPAVVAMMWVVILDPSIGAANYLLSLMGLPPSAWLSSPQLVLPIFAVLDSWQYVPFVALLILGGLKTLPTEVYEAAALDGAAGWRLLRHITLPLLTPTLVTAVVLRSIDLLRFFDLIYIITQGGPANASTTLNIYSFRRAFQFFDMGYASTLMITLTVLVFGFVAALMRLRRQWEAFA